MKNADEIERVLLLLKIDSKNLFDRILERKAEYIGVFSAKRVRDHFHDIFFTRYNEFSIQELKQCSQDTITTLDQFYTLTEQMRWYLLHTEDMPNAVEDHVARFIKRIDTAFNTLSLYLDAELGIHNEENNEQIEQINSELEISPPQNEENSN